MKKEKSKIPGLYSLIMIVFVTAYFFVSIETYAQTEDPYNVLEIKTEIDEGEDKEMKILFEGERRKIVQLTLRNDTRLGFHNVEEPILIQHISGSGEVIIKNNDTENTIELGPGKTVTIEGNVMHDVAAKPSVSILLIRFLPAEKK